MVRNLQVYPKVILDGSTWRAIGKVDEAATGTRSRFEHLVPAGVTADTPLLLLKVVFDLTVENTDIDRFVDDALFTDDIHPNPNTTETVWGNWKTTAEGIITGLPPGFTADDFQAAWTTGDTQAMRSDAQRALETGPAGGRGWTITSFHQHEGTGPPWVTEEGI